MILSGADVQQYIEHGGLRFNPVLSPEQFQQNGVDLIVEDLQVVKGNFALGCTREIVYMPNDLMAFVQMRSSWARRGFFMGGTVIDAGFKGQITLEILSHSEPHENILGQRFVHLIFAKLTSPSEPYSGRYQNQRGITGAYNG